jgi:hypothetical protein
LKEILSKIIGSVFTSIENGWRSSEFSEVYKKMHLIVDGFLRELGVYTHEFKVGEKIKDYDHVRPVSPVPSYAVTANRDLKDTICKVETLEYLFEADMIVLEADVVVWRVS